MARYDIDGRVALVTGAARGIGAETARQLAARGARVVLVGLEPELLAALAAELGEDRAAWFEADVTDYAALERAVAGAVARFGGVDVAIANAGIAELAPLDEIDLDAYDRIVAVNLGGAFRTLRATHAQVTARAGYFLSVASLAAALHAPQFGPYAATKAGVEAQADVLRQEVAATGARVGVAYLSFVDTDMVRDLDEQREPAASPTLDRLLARRVSVESAGAAIARGVERRADRICAPGWVRPAIALRTLAQPLLERVAVRELRRRAAPPR